MDLLETITRRVSVRNYRQEPAAPEEIEAVRRSGETAESLTPAEFRFLLRSHEEMGGEVKGILGDYGRIIRAPHYVVLAAKEMEGYLVDAGFRFEHLILEATRRGLGTCWIGGLFQEVSLRATLGLDPMWRVVALTPVGRPAEPTFVSRAMRAAARSAKRKPIGELFFWERHGSPLPKRVLADERLARVLEAARWAPSWANKQPWRFVLSGPEVLVYKQKRQIKEGKDYHALDCGIAMAHLHLAARALGLNSRWELGRFHVPGLSDAEPIGKCALHPAIG